MVIHLICTAGGNEKIFFDIKIDTEGQLAKGLVMKQIINFYVLLSLLLLSACGDSIKDAVEDIKVTEAYTLLDVLKKSKLINSYEMKVMDDDPLRGEVAVVINLKKDATYSDQKLLRQEKDAYLVILAQFFLSQTMYKDTWSLGRHIIKGQLFTGDKALSKPFLLHPSIFLDLLNNKKINIDKLENAQGYYWNQ